MRRGTMGGKRFHTPNGGLIGIATGSDATAEHECGISGLRNAFGLDSTKDGLKRRIIHKLPTNFVFRETPGYTALLSLPQYRYEGVLDKQLDYWIKSELREPSTLFNNNPDQLVCAWDENSFGLVAYGEKDSKDRKDLRELYTAFQKLDVAFWPNVGVFHECGGLLIMIVSRIPEDDKKKILEIDLDKKKMLKTAEATGIEKRLRKAGKEWLALSPAWISENRKVSSKYPVMFWLNPFDQRNNNYGWYTVEEFELWIENKGPIPNNKERR